MILLNAKMFFIGHLNLNFYIVHKFFTMASYKTIFVIWGLSYLLFTSLHLQNKIFEN